jgi:hypothetical protein
MAALRCYCGISSTVLVARKKNSSRTAIIRASMDGGCSRNEESKAGGTNSVRVTGKQVNKVYRHSFLPRFDMVSI